MIHSGTRPAKHLHRVRKYYHLGAVAADAIPDFDLGKNLPLQDQEQDQAPFECVGYTAAHILHSIFGQSFSPDFSYAAARYIAGDGPEGFPGTSFHAGLDSMVAVGGLIKGLATHSASAIGEHSVSDWAIWTQEEKRSALKQAQNGSRNVLGNGDAFDSILSALTQGHIPVSLGSPWFDQWRTNIQGGVVQPPILDGNYQGWHDYTADGKVTLNGVPYLIIYSHQGTRVGDNGKLYFSRETINATLSVPGAGALTVEPSAIRWLSILGLLSLRFPQILAYLPLLLHL